MFSVLLRLFYIVVFLIEACFGIFENLSFFKRFRDVAVLGILF